MLKRGLKLFKKYYSILIYRMELNETMLKINRLEQKIASISDEIDKRYKSIICKYCDLPATHLLITGKFPNYVETMICYKCSDYIDNLNCYQLDIMGFVDLYKL